MGIFDILRQRRKGQSAIPSEQGDIGAQEGGRSVSAPTAYDGRPVGGGLGSARPTVGNGGPGGPWGSTSSVMHSGMPPSPRGEGFEAGSDPYEGAGPVGVGAFGAAAGGAAGYDALVEESLGQPVIGKDQIKEAMDIWRRYKAGKARLEKRIIENEEWWRLRHWEQISEQGTTSLRTKSAWLVNVILSKHADAMDALPEPNCLPRAMDDEEEAKRLSRIVPVVLGRNDFDAVWSEAWWKKLKAGFAIYGVFWDSSALNGLGDIAVRAVDPLRIFWEPGVTDLQDSRNIFVVTLVDNEVLEEQHPELAGELKGGKTVTLNEYLYDDHIDTSNKSPVVDWYYRRPGANGRTVLHYAQFVGEHLLYATENEPELTQTGLYDHGLYPFFTDVLFPEEGTPAGFGYVDICKDAQRQIDLMNNAIVANCIAAATPRWLRRGDGAVNEEELLDWTRPVVHVEGSIEDAAFRQITVQPLTGNYLGILDSKIAELKETSGNRDVNNGGIPSGVTAASAIAAMQEQSGKLSRDQIQNSYNCFRRIVYCVIELIRQFYDLPRQFRIIGEEGAAEYINYTNQRLQLQPTGVNDLPRLPVFDIEVNAQKQSAYNKLSYNELAIQFFQLGFFNPQMSDQALAAIDMMEFKGKETVRQKIQENGGMFQMLQALMAQVQMLRGGQPNEPQQAQGGGQSAPAGRPAAIPDTDSLGRQQQRNGVAEKAKDKAQQATQPR